MLVLITMILGTKLSCKIITPYMVTMLKLERHCLEMKCRKSKVLRMQEEETLVWGILEVVVAIFDQNQETTLGGNLMAIMDMEEDLEVAILELSLVLEEAEQDVLENPDISTRVGGIKVVMTAMEEGIMEAEIKMILEIITSNLTLVQ